MEAVDRSTRLPVILAVIHSASHNGREQVYIASRVPGPGLNSTHSVLTVRKVKLFPSFAGKTMKATDTR